MHPDAVIAIAAAADGERLTREIFGAEMGWIPWQRPGFDLGLKLGALCREKPGLRGIVLGGHGLFTWGDTSRACYENTLEVINRAAAYLTEHASTAPFGGPRHAPLDPQARQRFVTELMPELRGRLSAETRKIGHFQDSPEVLEFVDSNRFVELAALGTSCPDHFLRTKIRPLVIDCDPGAVSPEDDRGRPRLSPAGSIARSTLPTTRRCKDDDSPALRDPFPVIVLVPRVGMLSFAKDKATARISAEFYVNAINVMRGAADVSEYVGLSEQEAFGIEYWALEEAKLQRMPPPKPSGGPRRPGHRAAPEGSAARWRNACSRTAPASCSAMSTRPGSRRSAPTSRPASAATACARPSRTSPTKPR